MSLWVGYSFATTVSFGKLSWDRVNDFHMMSATASGWVCGIWWFVCLRSARGSIQRCRRWTPCVLPQVPLLRSQNLIFPQTRYEEHFSATPPACVVVVSTFLCHSTSLVGQALTLNLWLYQTWCVLEFPSRRGPSTCIQHRMTRDLYKLPTAIRQLLLWCGISRKV